MPRLAPVSSSVRGGWLVCGVGIASFEFLGKLRIEPRLGPGRAVAPENDAIMQTERPVVPELDGRRHDAIAGPLRRPRHGAERVLGGIERDGFFEGEPAFQGLRLPARPGADLSLLR